MYYLASVMEMLQNVWSESPGPLGGMGSPYSQATEEKPLWALSLVEIKSIKVKLFHTLKVIFNNKDMFALLCRNYYSLY